MYQEKQGGAFSCLSDPSETPLHSDSCCEPQSDKESPTDELQEAFGRYPNVT